MDDFKKKIKATYYPNTQKTIYVLLDILVSFLLFCT